MSTDSNIKTENVETLADDGAEQVSIEPESPDFDRQMNIMADVREVIGQTHCDQTSSSTEMAADKLKRARNGLIIAMTDCLVKIPPNENRVRLHYFLSEILLLIETSRFCLEEKA
ncbi:hypothetical protein ACTUL6_000140 [Yersinia enterocolitica]